MKNADVIEDRQEAVESFLKELDDFEDDREPHKVRHTLPEVFLLVLCAQVSGYETLREYVFYGEMKLDFLRRFLPYRFGSPSRSTIARVLALLEPGHLEELFECWLQKVIGSSPAQVIAVDGKTHRGIEAKETEGLHIVTAFATESGLTLGMEKVADKSNEITAIPALLERLHIKGQIISIDAMGCQKAIVQLIRRKEADYVLALKGNQGTLHKDIDLYFCDPAHRAACSLFEHNDKGHGRVETRRCYVSSDLAWLQPRDEWVDLQTLVMVESLRWTKGKETKETRYFISSMPPDPKAILKAIRAHWGIENSLHWCLDVIFREDDHISWNQNIAHNESAIRRIALNLLKDYQISKRFRNKTEKVAIKTLRKIIIADDEGFAQVIKRVFS
jgi:predicted transposase YbfD/YdcC